MKATQILVEEHRIILKVLECLQEIVNEAEEQGRLNTNSALMAVDFFKNFADGCHHAKEEDRLFIVMQQHGIPVQGGPIGVMLHEHDEGRNAVRGMADSLDKAGKGDGEALHKFCQNAREFIPLLQNHIQKEDQVLFPMADHTLGEKTAATLLADFKQIEKDAGGKRHGKYGRIAADLCERYKVPPLAASGIQTLQNEFTVS